MDQEEHNRSEAWRVYERDDEIKVFASLKLKKKSRVCDGCRAEMTGLKKK